jgi:hypothetical protein
MAVRRILIIANEAPADPAELSEGVRKEILEAGEVRVIAPILTTRLQSWARTSRRPWSKPT